MTKINLHEVKSRLSYYTRRVKAGETIILCDRNKVFVEIRPLPDPAKPVPKRKLGLMKGMCPIGPEFFDADKEIAAEFENSGIFPVLSGAEKP